MSLQSFDRAMKRFYMPRLAAQLDTEGRGVAYFERLYALPDPPDGVIAVHLDDEELTRVGELRRFDSVGGETVWWQAWADDVPGDPIARSRNWDEAADALLAWPGLPVFTKALTVELAAAQRDLRRDLHRQIFG